MISYKFKVYWLAGSKSFGRWTMEDDFFLLVGFWKMSFGRWKMDFGRWKMGFGR